MEIPRRLRALINASRRNLGAIGADGRRLLARLIRDEAGSYLPAMTVLMPVMIGFAGLGSETGLWYYSHQAVQGAADAAAASAAVDLDTSTTAGVTTQARAIAATYGFVNGTGGVTVTLNNPPLSGNHTTNTSAVEVIVTQPQTRFFSGFWNSSALNVSGRAVATLGPNGSGGGCLLALDTTASGAIGASGGANITMTGCSVYSNSNSNTSISMSGGAQMTAYKVSTVGDKSLSGGATITTTPIANNIAIHAAAISDPYSNVTFPSHGSCTNLGTITNTRTLSPGCYSGLNLSSGANVTLSAGTYVLTGTLSVSGSGTLTGTDGVTLAFASNASAQFSGSSTVRLTAPTTGTTAGMVMFGDRAMTTGTNFDLSGGSLFRFKGAIYLPKANLKLSGGSDSANPGCNQIIADKVTLSGGAILKNNCVATGVKPFGTTGQLVE